MDTKPITPAQSAPHARPPADEQLAVEFLFNDKAPPTPGEMALLASILPDVLAEVRSLLNATKEN